MSEQQNISDLQGKTKLIDCLGCARERGEITQGNIFKSQYFDVHQDYEIPIPGFLILSSRRHIQSVDEFTSEEQADFIAFLVRVRLAMRQALGIATVYLVQEEDTSHHFHVWIFSRYDWMAKQFGTKIESLRPIMEYARKHMKTKENLEKVDSAVEKVKQLLSKNIE